MSLYYKSFRCWRFRKVMTICKGGYYNFLLYFFSEKMEKAERYRKKNLVNSVNSSIYKGCFQLKHEIFSVLEVHEGVVQVEASVQCEQIGQFYNKIPGESRDIFRIGKFKFFARLTDTTFMVPPRNTVLNLMPTNLQATSKCTYIGLFI